MCNKKTLSYLKGIILILLILSTYRGFSQSPWDFNNRNRIKVIGGTDTLLVPTSYVLDINLKETTDQGGRMNNRPVIIVSIDSAEKALRQYIERLGLDSKKLKLVKITNTMSGFAGNELVVEYKRFEYELKDYKALQKFVKDFRFEGLAALRLRKLYDIDRSALETQLIIAALVDAKIKVNKILSSVGKEVGDILSLETQKLPLPRSEESNLDYWNGAMGDIDLSDPKYLRFEVYVIYEIR